MLSGLTHVSLPVLDYDEALRWYTEKLGLEIRDNVEMNEYGSPEARMSLRNQIKYCPDHCIGNR